MNLTSSCDTKPLISGSEKAVIKHFVMKHFMTHNANNLPQIFNPSTA